MSKKHVHPPTGDINALIARKDFEALATYARQYAAAYDDLDTRTLTAQKDAVTLVITLREQSDTLRRDADDAHRRLHETSSRLHAQEHEINTLRASLARFAQPTVWANTFHYPDGPEQPDTKRDVWFYTGKQIPFVVAAHALHGTLLPDTPCPTTTLPTNTEVFNGPLTFTPSLPKHVIDSLSNLLNAAVIAGNDMDRNRLLSGARALLLGALDDANYRQRRYDTACEQRRTRNLFRIFVAGAIVAVALLACVLWHVFAR